MTTGFEVHPGRWLTPNVYAVPLGRCDVDWHVDRGIVAVAGVGQDMIKVWPLPVEQPWWEDLDAPMGWKSDQDYPIIAVP